MLKEMILSNAYEYIDRFTGNVFASDVNGRLAADLKKLNYICKLKDIIKETEDNCGITKIKLKLKKLKYRLRYFDAKHKAMLYKEHISQDTMRFAEQNYYDLTYEIQNLESELLYISDHTYVKIDVDNLGES